MIDVLGYIGNGLLMLCGAPLALRAIRERRADVDTTFTIMWYIGEILALVYVLLKFGFEYPLLMNYGFNILAISIVIYYKYWGKA